MEKAIKTFQEKLQLWKELAEQTNDPDLKVFFLGEASGALHLMEEIFLGYSEKFLEIYTSYGFC